MHGLLKVGTTDCFTLQVKQSLGGTRWDNDTPKPGGGVATYGDPNDQRTNGRREEDVGDDRRGVQERPPRYRRGGGARE